jgi:hypothetical protein
VATQHFHLSHYKIEIPPCGKIHGNVSFTLFGKRSCQDFGKISVAETAKQRELHVKNNFLTWKPWFSPLA